MVATPQRKASLPAKAHRDSEAPSSILHEEHLSLDECAGLVEVQEVSTGIGSVCEEVAVLYANGNTREAETLLDALLSDSSHAANEWPWTMLLDLYRLTGQRERFEARVIEFATRFERSPPPWQDLSVSAPRSRSGAAPAVNLGGVLSQSMAKQIAQFVVLGQKNGSVRIDLQTLRSADEAGCTLLLDALATLRRDRVKVSLSNVDKLSDALAAKLKPGARDHRPVWLALLELLQHGGDQERFEQWALDYAITFEESPPSWAPVAASAEAPSASVGGVRMSAADLAFEGEIVGGGSALIGRLVALAEERNHVIVDCSRLRRMDFVSAGTLFNVLSTLQGKGRSVTLSDVNAMVLALLHVMGVGQVAKIVPRA